MSDSFLQPRVVAMLSVVLGLGCGADAAQSIDPQQVRQVAIKTASPNCAVIADASSPLDAGLSMSGPAALPPAPEPPADPRPLSVEGFGAASHVGPDDRETWPRPVTIVLHGNFDRPEWECDVWKDVAAYRGWVICPRGVRTPWASRAEDRWTYKWAGAVRREIEAALVALEKQYPARVTRDQLVLAGFSLGAILAPKLVELDPGRYPYIFLVEGGVKKLDKQRIRSLKKAGVRGIALAMSAPGRRRLATAVIPKLERIGLRAVFVDMRGAGHGYRADFAVSGMQGLKALLKSSDKEME